MVSVSTLPRCRDVLALDGTWSFALDPQDTGTKDSWHSQEFDAHIQLPGSWEEQGFGDPPAPDFLGTWTKNHEYEGAAWYSRTIAIPTNWHNHLIEIHLRGVRWRSRLWVDDHFIGERDSLSVAHTYDLTDFVGAGQHHRLTIQIDNRLIYPLLESHPNSEHTATRWGGITGGAELTARPRTGFQQVKCTPHVATKRFDFDVELALFTAADYALEVIVSSPVTGETFIRQMAVENTHTQLAVELGDHARLWWDDDPFLYQVTFMLRQGEQVIDILEKRAGLREIAIEGRNIMLNGSPVFLRGYVDCCIFPQTGYPVWDIDQYRRQFQIAKSYGFNHVRLHSWTPPAPFWEAADELGMLVQTELPNWTTHYGYAEHEPPDDVHQFLLRELEQIVEELNFHPAWVLFSNGNELIYGTDGHPRLIELVQRGKQLDPTRLFTDNTGFGELPASSRPVDFYIQSCNWHPPQKIYDSATNNTTQDFGAVTAFADRPVLGHEHGQFTMYVRPSEAEKYTGVIRPSWLESINATLAAKNMTALVDEYIQASGTHTARTYKETIERARRTRGLAGIQLLDIRDFPGQGHATTGMLDVFWDSKGLIEPAKFAEFNNAAVLLMRSPSPTFWNGADIGVEIQISNFGRAATGTQLRWELHNRRQATRLAGEITVPAAPAGELTSLGRLAIAIPKDTSAQAWELTVHLDTVQNSWHIWTYPYPQPTQPTPHISTRIKALRNVLPQADFSDDFTGSAPRYVAGRRVYPAWQLAISDVLTGRLLQYLHDGGSVWLMPDARQLYDYARTRYLPPFWSYLWFPENTSTVMGMVIHDHPALGDFPHDNYSDWQWYALVNDTPAICLDAVPQIEPVVEVVDNFNRAKRLCYAFEAQVGRGRLFVSTWRLYDPTVTGHPEARFLFSQLVQYLQSDTFAPASRLSVGELLGLFKLANNLAGNLLE